MARAAGTARRDVGTGMSDAEVDELSTRIDLAALRGYWDAVTARTLEVVDTLRGERSRGDGGGRARQARGPRRRHRGPGRGVLTEFWAGRRSRAWVLAQMALLHPFGHYYEARVAAGLWGVRSP
jgi:hypothetical protein